MSVATAIEFERVTKRYHIVQRATPRLGAWVVNKLFEHLRRVPFLALDDVSFTVPQGQMLGLLGTNGAGKSTVLKLVAGITQPTSGQVRVRGRIASLLELGVGFHPDLTGMENIFYNGALMGLSRQEILDRLEAIVAFSGLEKFLYEPVRHYSSGMYARLGCSVALHVEPDVVLIDEILAVGDAEFQQRSMNRLLELHERGVTLVLVSHAISASRDLCDRLIWLDHGRVRADGAAREVVGEYLRYVHELAMPPSHFLHPARELAEETDAAKRGVWTRATAPRMARVELLGGEGSAMEEVRTGEPVRFAFHLDGADSAPAAFRVALCVSWPDGRELFHDVSEPIEPGPANSPVVYEVPVWPYLRGEMLLGASVVSEDRATVLCRAPGLMPFRTISPPAHYIDSCILAPVTTWEVARGGDAAS